MPDSIPKIDRAPSGRVSTSIEENGQEVDVSQANLRVEIRKDLRHERSVFTLNVALTAKTGFTILFGPSGAGKTTILDCIAGIQHPDAGEIAIGSRIFFSAARGIDIPPARRGMGYVFQDLALFPHLTAAENIEYGLARIPREARRDKVRNILDVFQILSLSGRKPNDLSGGERQRIALARALVTDPALLLLDEPLAALDAATKSHIVDDLRAWNRQHKIPILYVTHSRDEVFALGERVVVLDGGSAIADGTPHEVFGAPRHETVAHLAGFENVFDATVRAIHEDRGTLTCRLWDGSGTGVEVETPLVRAGIGDSLRVGIRAGDILIATIYPKGLSARNVLQGRIASVERKDVIVSTRVSCGVEMEVHLTLAARDALNLEAGREVWLVIKTHSCHLMQK